MLEFQAFFVIFSKNIEVEIVRFLGGEKLSSVRKNASPKCLRIFLLVSETILAFILPTSPNNRSHLWSNSAL